MIWILLFLLGAVAWILITLGKGKLNFWKLVSKYPDESYGYFKKHSEAWLVLDNHDTKEIFNHLYTNKPDFKKKWAGPYRLFVPSINEFIQIYGKDDVYQDEQEKLISLLKTKEKEIFK